MHTNHIMEYHRIIQCHVYYTQGNMYYMLSGSTECLQVIKKMRIAQYRAEHVLFIDQKYSV